MAQIVPFCMDNNDCLSFDEKINILCSCNLINAIIETVNCKKKNNHNILLEELNSETIRVYDGENFIETNTDLSLMFLIDAKIIDLNLIVNEFADYLDDIFLLEIRKYLNGGCNDEPNFRNKKCDPKKIFKPHIKFHKLKKALAKK